MELQKHCLQTNDFHGVSSQQAPFCAPIIFSKFFNVYSSRAFLNYAKQLPTVGNYSNIFLTSF